MPPKKPLQVVVFENKHHRSKKQIEQRANTEIKLGDKKLILNSSVKRDKVALNKWKELVTLYDEMDYVSSADSGILSQYCLCYSELENLLNKQEEILKDLKKQKKTALEIVVVMDKTNLDNMINKKREALQKIVTKIFLDPTARIKAIPLKEPEKPKTHLESSGFGAI